MAILRSWFRATVLAAAITLLIANPLCGQQNSQPSPNSASEGQSGDQYTFKLNVNRVVVDVVVTDQNAKPVRGLTKQDFSIYEDGKPQNIVSFDMHSLDSNPSYFAKLLRSNRSFKASQ